MDIKKVGVVGCGLMGAGIAQTAAQAGYTTIVRELNSDLLEKGLDRISSFLDKGVDKGKLSPSKRDATRECISGTTDLIDLADCDLVIEVIFEDLNAKQELFKEMDGICREDTIFASNTSSLSIAEMASATKRSERVVGLHYFFPSVINQLLEVVTTDQTETDVLETLLVFARTTGKVPIVARDAPGFAVNRYFVPWLNEAARMLDEGLANIPTIDKAACDRFKIGMGPFALMNATGIPIAHHCTVSFRESLGEFYGPADSLTAQLEAGEPWDLQGEVDETATGVIEERLMGVVFGVAAQLVEEDVASIESTERGALIGLRWPRGPFGMMNDIGMERAIELVGQIASHHDAFGMPKLFRQQLESGQPWILRDVKLEIKDQIAIITMNRPEAMNALNEKVLGELKETIAQLQEDTSVRVVIITGEGPAFVAGADIHTMLAKDLSEIEEFTRFGQEVMNAIERLNKPVIAAINGFALGGGLELALACDIRLATTEARMGFPEVGLGIFPGFGGTQRTTRLIGKGRACELIFTGDHINAEEAARIGLVNRVVLPQNLMGEANRLARRIAKQGPLAVMRAKTAINQALQKGLDDGLAIELEEVIRTFDTQDQKEGMLAFVERRKPQFKRK
ncbi:MAG: 3-hydroxyacyl-CoA dehydrogenase/enoyl-CoA hydratase family protein [Anaerolineales bacterium]|nr:3-hydroxyacyl-CoA dehydrogenase/enoyl-CoA hydratase family protein [Anaerolineales bacterium]